MITRSSTTRDRHDIQGRRGGQRARVHRVRGLTNTLVPDSTRAFTGYLFGAPDYKTLTWEELLQVATGPVVNPFLNDVQTLASSADDLSPTIRARCRASFSSTPKR